MTGNVLNITRFATDDGPGIRTTVFLKGCPLRCLWCHNPESQKSRPELFYDADKCVGCRMCGSVCENGCHVFDETHSVIREKCVVCGKCAEVCPKKALSVYGKRMMAEEIVSTAARDKVFYRKNGGITVSGGEPLFQADFTAEILKLAKSEGIHTVIETSGFADAESLEKVLRYCDLVLFDIKETNERLHKEYTGVSSETILANLKRIDEAGIPTILRLPVIPGLNDREDHFRKVNEIRSCLANCRGVEVMPYHILGKYKYSQLGREYSLQDVAEPDSETKEKWRSYFK